MAHSSSKVPWVLASNYEPWKPQSLRAGGKYTATEPQTGGGSRYATSRPQTGNESKYTATRPTTDKKSDRVTSTVTFQQDGGGRIYPRGFTASRSYFSDRSRVIQLCDRRDLCVVERVEKRQESSLRATASRGKQGGSKRDVAAETRVAYSEGALVTETESKAEAGAYSTTGLQADTGCPKFTGCKWRLPEDYSPVAFRPKTANLGYRPWSAYADGFGSERLGHIFMCEQNAGRRSVRKSRSSNRSFLSIKTSSSKGPSWASANRSSNKSVSFCLPDEGTEIVEDGVGSPCISYSVRRVCSAEAVSDRPVDSTEGRSVSKSPCRSSRSMCKNNSKRVRKSILKTSSKANDDHTKGTSEETVSYAQCVDRGDREGKQLNDQSKNRRDDTKTIDYTHNEFETDRFAAIYKPKHWWNVKAMKSKTFSSINLKSKVMTSTKQRVEKSSNKIQLTSNNICSSSAGGSNEPTEVVNCLTPTCDVDSKINNSTLCDDPTQTDGCENNKTSRIEHQVLSMVPANITLEACSSMSMTRIVKVVRSEDQLYDQHEVAPGEPEVALGEPEVAPREPEVAPGEPEVSPGKPEEAPGEPEVAPGDQTWNRRLSEVECVGCRGGGRRRSTQTSTNSAPTQEQLKASESAKLAVYKAMIDNPTMTVPEQCRLYTSEFFSNNPCIAFLPWQVRKCKSAKKKQKKDEACGGNSENNEKAEKKKKDKKSKEGDDDDDDGEKEKKKKKKPPRICPPPPKCICGVSVNTTPVQHIKFTQTGCCTHNQYTWTENHTSTKHVGTKDDLFTFDQFTQVCEEDIDGPPPPPSVHSIYSSKASTLSASTQRTSSSRSTVKSSLSSVESKHSVATSHVSFYAAPDCRSTQDNVHSLVSNNDPRGSMSSASKSSTLVPPSFVNMGCQGQDPKTEYPLAWDGIVASAGTMSTCPPCIRDPTILGRFWRHTPRYQQVVRGLQTCNCCDSQKNVCTKHNT